MRLSTFAVTATALLFAAVMAAQEPGARAKLYGKWHTGNGSAEGETWVIEEKDDAVRLSHSTADQKPIEIECNTMGRECEVKELGKKVKISMWYSGPKLVQIETRGSDVVKRQFAVAENGDTMELEVIPVVPPGKAELVQFKRQEIAAAQK